MMCFNATGKCTIYVVLFYFTVNGTGANEDDVREINELIKQPMWTHYYSVFEAPEYIKDYVSDTEYRLIPINALFSNSGAGDDGGGTIVSNENFYDKVRQFHLLLSCFYSFKIKDFVDYVRKIREICSRWNLKICKKRFPKKVSDFSLYLHRMTKSLEYFAHLANRSRPAEPIIFTNELQEGVFYLHRLTINISLHTDQCFFDELTRIYLLVKSFMKKHCVPLPADVEEDGNDNQVSEKTRSLEAIEQLNDYNWEGKIQIIYDEFKKHLRETKKLNRLLGFKHNKVDQSVSVRPFVSNTSRPYTPPPPISSNSEG